MLVGWRDGIDFAVGIADKSVGYGQCFAYGITQVGQYDVVAVGLVDVVAAYDGIEGDFLVGADDTVPGSVLYAEDYLACTIVLAVAVLLAGEVLELECLVVGPMAAEVDADGVVKGAVGLQDGDVTLDVGGHGGLAGAGCGYEGDEEQYAPPYLTVKWVICAS